MPMVMIESVQEFIQRHGGNPIGMPESERLLLPDGASCTIDGSMRCEPPQSPYDLMLNRRRYLVEHLHRSQEQFNQAKRSVMDQAALALKYPNLPGVSADDVAVLERLKAEADQHRLTLETFDAEHVQSNEAEIHRQAALAAREQELRSLLQQFKTIQI